jgi:arsenate reductase-like glutaredoxin family protein
MAIGSVDSAVDSAGMPAPPIQLFGRRDSRETQGALRFFKERRIEVSFVDVARKAPAPAELRRFVDRLGARALIDSEGKRYRDAGLAWIRMDEAETLERLLADPGLLRLPLARFGSEVSAGADEAAWRRWAEVVRRASR